MSEYEQFKRIAKSLNGDETLIVPYEEAITNTQPLNLGLTSIKTSSILKARFLTFEEGLKLLQSDIESATNVS
jgi:hypothetical protein